MDHPPRKQGQMGRLCRHALYWKRDFTYGCAYPSLDEQQHAWLYQKVTNNGFLSPPSKTENQELRTDLFRATTLALLVMIGQAMSIASAQVYSDAPYYIRGNSFSLTFTVLGAILTGVFVWYLARKNAAKSANQRSDEAGAKRSMNIEEIQDEHPDFFYYL